MHADKQIVFQVSLNYPYGFKKISVLNDCDDFMNFLEIVNKVACEYLAIFQSPVNVYHFNIRQQIKYCMHFLLE